MRVAIDIGVRVYRRHSWPSILRLIGRHAVISAVLLRWWLGVAVRLLRRWRLCIAISTRLWWRWAVILRWVVVRLGWVLLWWWWSSISSVVSRSRIARHFCSPTLSRRKKEDSEADCWMSARRQKALPNVEG